MKMRRDVLLKSIADLLITFENPTDSNLERVISAYIEIDKELYEYDGEKFVKIDKSLTFRVVK